MSGVPISRVEEGHRSHRLGKLSRQTKRHDNQSFKWSSYVQDHGAVAIGGRLKRAWKACERCRMRKSKCSGEIPCKRCKDDGMVCTAVSRKNIAFKQFPRGYAEVLENTQYALTVTVQKLYTMIRNNESWNLGEPESND